MTSASRTDTWPASSLSQATLVALVVANMVGAGVFTSSGFSLSTLGSPGRVMLAWGLCGVWALCGAVAYGALAARLPLSGGEYLFLHRLVHPSIGFLAGWISVIAGFTAPIAAAALGAVLYALPAGDSGDLQVTYLAAGVIVLACGCHLLGLKWGAGAQNAIVAAKLCLLTCFVVWAWSLVPEERWQGSALPGQDPSWLPADLDQWTVLVGSMSWLALSYTGFNAAIYVAGESQDAQRAVPRAMWLATLVVTVLYLALNAIFVYGPAPELIAGQERVATIAAQALGGTALAQLMQLTIVLSMVSSVLAMLMAGPRVYQRMADDGVMPQILASKSGSPRLSIIIQTGLSIVALLMADLLQLMKYLGLTLSACGALAVVSLWWLRRRLPDARPLQWWEQLAVMIYVAITLLILAASRSTHPEEFTAMLVTFGTGIVVYLIWSQLERRSTEIPAKD